MVIVSADRDLEKLTWVTNTKVTPNRIIYCKNCPGIIMFNIEEIEENRKTGKPTSTPCKYCNYHPGFPPEPHYLLDGNIALQQSEHKIQTVGSEQG